MVPSWLSPEAKVEPGDGAVTEWLVPRASGPVNPAFAAPAPPPPEPEPVTMPAVEPAPPEPSPAEIEATRQLPLLSQAFAEVKRAGQEYRHQITAQMLELAFEVASELAGGAIEYDHNRLMALASEAVGLLDDSDGLVVRLEPSLHERMQTEGLLDELGGLGNVVVRPDPQVNDMGCIVDSAVSSVDARVQSRLARFRHVFKEEAEVVL